MFPVILAADDDWFSGLTAAKPFPVADVRIKLLSITGWYDVTQRYLLDVVHADLLVEPGEHNGHQ